MRRAIMSNKMNYRWDGKKVEELIELYRTAECLWNCSDKDYLNVDKRKACLRQIGERLEGLSTGEFSNVQLHVN